MPLDPSKIEERCNPVNEEQPEIEQLQLKCKKLVVEDVAKIALAGRYNWTNLMVVRICN